MPGRDLLAFAEAKFVQEAQHELSMLKYVLGVNVLDSIVGCVDIRVAILESSLEDERRGVSVPCSRAVIRASIATDAVYTLNIRVLRIH